MKNCLHMFYFFPFHLPFTPHSLWPGLCSHQSAARILAGTRNSVRAERAVPRDGPVQNWPHHQNLSPEFIKSVSACGFCLRSQKLFQVGPRKSAATNSLLTGTFMAAPPSPQGPQSGGSVLPRCHTTLCSPLSHWPNLFPFPFLISSSHPIGASNDLS